MNRSVAGISGNLRVGIQMISYVLSAPDDGFPLPRPGSGNLGVRHLITIFLRVHLIPDFCKLGNDYLVRDFLKPWKSFAIFGHRLHE